MSSDAVTVTAALLDTARAPITPRQWPPLADPGVLAEVRSRLAAAGRQVVHWPAPEGAAIDDEQFLSTVDDEVAQALVISEPPQLCAQDAAVLMLVILHSVLLPRKRGELDATGPWGHGKPVSLDTLRANRSFQMQQYTESLTRLKTQGLLGRGNVPGPAWQRLSPSQQHRILGNLVLVCRPGSFLAEEIRRQCGTSATSGDRPRPVDPAPQEEYS